MKVTEDQLEQLCLSWFADTGWQTAHGPDLSPGGAMPERDDYRDVLLTPRLTAAVQRLNPGLPGAVVKEVVHTVATPEHPSLVRNNRTFHRLILRGVPVTYRTDAGEERTDHALLVDFSNPSRNDLLVVNQYTVTGTKINRRPDLVVFVNGLPLSVIELKNPADETADVWKAYDQLQTYKDEIGDLLAYNEALVISDGTNARVGALTASPEWFMPWRTIKNENDRPLLEFQLEKIVRGFFNPALFLDYVRHFVLFEETDGAIIKKIAGYHQFHGVREAVRVTLIAAAPSERERAKDPRASYGLEVEPGSGKAGVFWHTQGSGKSISMCCYAGKLIQQPAMRNPTLVIVTDRNDLDGQLFAQFSAAEDLLRQTPVQATSRDELRAFLDARQAGGIIFTTVQKFSLLGDEDNHPVLSTRSNVVVISDEAHRSQYGLEARLDPKTGKYVYGYAKYLRDALPNASFIGFTGTPLSSEDKDTRAVFGDYVSVYDIQDAVDDGATVPIFYESRLAKLDLNSAAIAALDDEVEDLIEEDEEAAREQTKSKWAQLEKLVGAKPRLEAVAADLVQHFETRTEALAGKGMIVCMSRAVCVALFDELIALRPEWAGTKLTNDGQDIGYNPDDGAIRIVMTGTATDKPDIREHVFTKVQKKALEKRFKDPNDPLRLVIVRDMWLTGFDVPSCHTMYVDKPMRGHNLMQAIARVNRVFKDKPGGLVVDYIGIATELKKALKTYTDAKGRGTPTLDAHEALAILLEKVDIVRGLLHGFDYSGFSDEPLALLVPAANHVLGLEDGKKRFLDAMAAVTKAYALCSTLDEATALREEIAFFSAIRAVIVKHTTTGEKPTEDQRQAVLQQILNNAVVAGGIQDVFALAGLEKPDIGLLSDAFLDDVRSMPERHLAVELLERLLRDEVKAHTRSNVVMERKYSERLEASLRRYHNRAIETAQVIEELIAMAKDFQAALERDMAFGLSSDEVAFYDALADNESAVRELGDDTLKKLATELTEKLRKSTTVDWHKRESVRARLRILIRRLLRRYKYPPDGEAAAIALVLVQAETLADTWTPVV